MTPLRRRRLTWPTPARSSLTVRRARVSGIGGNADAEIRLQAYDGTAWVTTALLSDASGNNTFTADWHTQFNRVLVNGGGSPTTGDQRLEVTNVSGATGDFSADGDER